MGAVSAEAINVDAGREERLRRVDVAIPGSNISGVNPFLVDTWGSAPALSKMRTISGWGSETAHIRAVLCVVLTVAFTSAPAVTSIVTMSALPVRAAVISGVSPLVCDAFTFAPAASNLATISRLAFSAARSSGVTP